MQEVFDYGFQGQIKFDQEVHRFHRDGKLNGWYVAFENQRDDGTTFQVVQYGDWKTGETFTTSNGGKVSKSDLEWIDKRKDELKFEKEMLYAQTAQKAQIIWKSCVEAKENEYLTKKEVEAHGARLHKGQLTIPVTDQDGQIWGLQFIGGDGRKKFLKGMRKKGNFFKIPGSKTVYITEGFSTGASVAQATGATVLVAFDAGNVKEVALNHPDAIVAGDNDKAGIKAAKGFKAVFPDIDQGTDWNDLAVEKGLDEVKRQIENYVQPASVEDRENELDFDPEPEAVIKCLGYNGDSFYFLSSSKPQITKISASSFSKSVLLSMCDLDFWEGRYPAKKSFDLEMAINDLMKQCRASGFFEPDNVRGTGVWLDGSKTVVNCGDHIISENTNYSLAGFKSDNIYEQGRKIPSHRKLPKPNADAFIELLECLSWRQQDCAKLLFGWLAVAPICGALSWRPHVWITGSSGSGKTTVMNEIVAKIVVGHEVTGRSTEAGIRQLLGSSALPLLFDENETTDQASMRRVESVIELFRQASSVKKASVVKGTPSGHGMSYNVKFCACVSSINVGLYQEQDINRFTVLELVTDPNNGFNEKGGVRDLLFDLLTDEFCAMWRSYAVENVENIAKLAKLFFERLRLDVNPRFAEQYGTILAGYACFTGFSVDEVLKDFQYVEFDNSKEDQNETDCINYILQSKIYNGGESYSVSRLIEKAQKEVTDVSNDLLSVYGLRVKGKYLAVALKHPELGKIMRDSSTPRKWGGALLRLEGSKKQTVRINGLPTRCALVKLQTL